MDKYLSIITNFGCCYTCPYCIVKNNNMHIPKTTVGGLDKLVENIEKYDCNWVSISGGDDPLHNLNKNKNWYYKLLEIIPDNVKLELHTSYISTGWWPDNWFSNSFDRIVYHCRSSFDIWKIKKTKPEQKIRVVFVVTEDFDSDWIDMLVACVHNNPDIDELSFRQMVDSGYNATHYCEDYLKAGHQKDWWYIQQCDYNIYYAENEVKFRFEDWRD